MKQIGIELLETLNIIRICFYELFIVTPVLIIKEKLMIKTK